MTDQQPSRQLTKDEWILLLDVYLSHSCAELTPKHPEILKASTMLNALVGIDGRVAGPVSVLLVAYIDRSGCFSGFSYPRQNQNRGCLS